MEQTQICPNCNKAIPMMKTATHFGYCRRNIIKCLTCGEIYDKNFLQDHQQQYHQTSKCKHCLKLFTKKQVQDHARICQMRPKYCEYCDQNVPSKDYNNHLKQCQSRTSLCQLCEKSIINKEYSIHIATCKGKIKTPVKKNQNQFKNESNKFNMQDSLTNVWQQNYQEKKYPNNNKERQKKQKPKQKQSAFKKQVKKQIIDPKKRLNEFKSSPKKEAIDPKSLSRQHFYDNYFNPSQYYQDEQSYNFNDNFDHLNIDDYNYLPQESFYGKSPFDFQTPSSFEYLNEQTSNISPQQQLIQQTIFESSKKGRNYHQNLPTDFYGEEIMSKSFYKDILDIQKQKAILEDLSKSKTKKVPLNPQKNNKPTNIQKPNPKIQRKR